MGASALRERLGSFTLEMKTKEPVSLFSVVYFDQQTHACACVRMVENNNKHLIMMKKVPFSSCTQEAHERLTKKNKEKSLLVSDWE